MYSINKLCKNMYSINKLCIFSVTLNICEGFFFLPQPKFYRTMKFLKRYFFSLIPGPQSEFK